MTKWSNLISIINVSIWELVKFIIRIKRSQTNHTLISPILAIDLLSEHRESEWVQMLYF